MVTALVLGPLMMLKNHGCFAGLMDYPLVGPCLQFLDQPLLKPWLHGAMLASLVCMVVLVAVSLCTSPPPPAKLQNTTVASLWGKDARAAAEDEMMAPRVPWLKDYRLWLAIVSAGTAAAWYVMR